MVCPNSNCSSVVGPNTVQGLSVCTLLTPVQIPVKHSALATASWLTTSGLVVNAVSLPATDACLRASNFFVDYGYDVRIMSPKNRVELVNIGNSWTAGLASHAAAAGSTILSFALLLIDQRSLFLTLVAFLTTLIAFMTDIVFYFHSRDILVALQVIGVNPVSNTGPGKLDISAVLSFSYRAYNKGFWVSLVVFCLVVAESSASEGDLKLKRLKNAMFSANKAFSGPSDAQPENNLLKDRNPIVPDKDLLYECPLCYESKLELRAMPCRGAHAFCRLYVRETNFTVMCSDIYLHLLAV